MKHSILKASVLALGALIASVSMSKAQTNCAPRDVVIDRLAEAYGETRHSVGLGQNNLVVEVFASSATGTWTITVTNAAGTTCLVASGQAFEALAETLPDATDDA